MIDTIEGALAHIMRGSSLPAAITGDAGRLAASQAIVSALGAKPELAIGPAGATVKRWPNLIYQVDESGEEVTDSGVADAQPASVIINVHADEFAACKRLSRHVRALFGGLSCVVGGITIESMFLSDIAHAVDDEAAGTSDYVQQISLTFDLSYKG